MVQEGRPTTSEYRGSFKESKFKCFTKNYEDCLDYRILRRSAEHNHNVAVFTWDDSDPKSPRDSDTDCHTGGRPQSVPIHKYKHELFNKAYQEKLAKSPAIKVNSDTGRVVVVNQSKANDHDPESLKLNLSATSSDKAKGKHSSMTTSKSHTVKPKPQSPIKKSAKEPVTSKSPFVAYGSQDKELLVATKKTHNVRASAEIHPSAIRAMQRHKLHRDLLDERAKSAPLNGRRKKALYGDFDEQMKRETHCWDTEYRNHYLGYAENIYSKSLSARFNPTRRPDLERLTAATS